MGFEITTYATVGENGHIEVDVPEFAVGQRVELVVRTKEAKPNRGFGSMRGEVLFMSEDFDDPLPEFDGYQ